MTSPSTRGRIILSDNLPVLRAMDAATVQLIYIDPPFNTGKVQSRTRIRVERDADGDRAGFQGRRYRTEVVGRSGYDDRHDDYIGFLEPRIREARRILEPTGSFFLHIDYREAHYCKILLDGVFGRASFMNEIIWAYDYGARSKRKWPAKHDTIFWYARDPTAYTFNFGEMDRIPYMAPGLVGKEKAARGKTPTDVWWHTIVSPTGREKTGYPTQKPLGVLERIVKVHSSPGDTVLDFFAGSGTTGEAAARHGRNFILVDSNPEAARVMAEQAPRVLKRTTGGRRSGFTEPETSPANADPPASGSRTRARNRTANLYVILLRDEVRRSRKFGEDNPDYRPGMPCVYVGVTSLDPEERFKQHKRGYKASRRV